MSSSKDNSRTLQRTQSTSDTSPLCATGELDPSAFKWQATPAARQELAKVYGSEGMAEFRDKLGKHLCCGYYPATSGRSKAMGVSPISCGVQDGRGFKVRWAYPGCGKSGGIRMAILALCPARRIIIAFACKRKEDPADKEVDRAFEGASSSSEPL